MTFFENVLGYDSRDNDLLGENRDPALNCKACGIALMLHTAEMNAVCFWTLYQPKSA
jgi:cyclic lactone autoinducer peptide